MSVGQTGHKVCLSHIDAHPHRIIQMWKRSYKSTQKCTLLGLKLDLYVNDVWRGEGILDICALLGLSALYSVLFQFVQSVYIHCLNLHFIIYIFLLK